MTTYLKQTIIYFSFESNTNKQTKLIFTSQKQSLCYPRSVKSYESFALETLQSSSTFAIKSKRRRHSVWKRRSS